MCVMLKKGEKSNDFRKKYTHNTLEYTHSTRIILLKIVVMEGIYV